MNEDAVAPGLPRDIWTVMVSRRRTSRGMASSNGSPVVTFETAARRRRNANIVASMSAAGIGGSQP
jgi:hypothetical protein